MKKTFFLGSIFLSILSLHAQINFSPAKTLTASTLHTNDVESLTLLQNTECFFCGPNYTVYSLHAATTSLAVSSYTFVPGFTYSIQINGSGTAAGDLSNPSASLIYFGVSLGTAVFTNQPTVACSPFPSSTGILAYPGQESWIAPIVLDFTGTSTVDLTNTFLANVVSIGTFPNSSTTSNSGMTLPTFTVSVNTSVFNIEAYPVIGDQPPLVPNNQDGGLGSNNPTNMPPTNTTLTINSITITKTPTIYYGTITAAPNWTVTTAPSSVSSQSGVGKCLIVVTNPTHPTNFTTPIFVATISGTNIRPSATRTFTAVGNGGGLWTTTINPNGTVYTQWVSGNPPPTVPAGTPYTLIMNGTYSL